MVIIILILFTIYMDYITMLKIILNLKISLKLMFLAVLY